MKGYVPILFAFLLFASASQVLAQNGPPPPPEDSFTARGVDNDSPNRRNILRRELNLTDDQMMMIRKINVDNRPKMRLAQQQVQAARKDLDQAIYADSLDEEHLKGRVRAVIEAEAEVSKLRAMSEVAVRKVLTPEQLVRFRELRSRFARQGEEMRRRSLRRQNERRARPNTDNPVKRPDDRL